MERNMIQQDISIVIKLKGTNHHIKKSDGIGHKRENLSMSIMRRGLINPYWAYRSLIYYIQSSEIQENIDET